MKATIDGIVIEGTIEEILEFKLKLERQKNGTYHIEKFLDKLPAQPYPVYPPYSPPFYTTTRPTPFNPNEVTCTTGSTICVANPNVQMYN